MNKLYKNSKDGKFLGVAQGLSEFISVDPTVIRLMFVLGTIVGCGSFLLIYLIMALVVPEKPEV